MRHTVLVRRVAFETQPVEALRQAVAVARDLRRSPQRSKRQEERVRDEEAEEKAFVFCKNRDETRRRACTQTEGLLVSGLRHREGVEDAPQAPRTSPPIPKPHAESLSMVCTRLTVGRWMASFHSSSESAAVVSFSSVVLMRHATTSRAPCATMTPAARLSSHAYIGTRLIHE